MKAYVIRQLTKMLEGRVRLQDFVFAKEVRMGSYAQDPPAAIVAKKVRDRSRPLLFFLCTYSLLQTTPRSPSDSSSLPFPNFSVRQWPVILAPSHAWASVWPTWR